MHFRNGDFLRSLDIFKCPTYGRFQSDDINLCIEVVKNTKITREELEREMHVDLSSVIDIGLFDEDEDGYLVLK